MDMYTLLYSKWITNKDLLYSTGNSAQCYVVPGWEGSLGENGYMYMYGWVPFCSSGTITTLLINHTPIKIKSLKKIYNSTKTT